MERGREMHIIIDGTITSQIRPLIELEKLVAQAIYLLACRAEVVGATIFRKPQSNSYWIGLTDRRHNLRELFELKRQALTIDFEIINQSVVHLVN